MATDSFTASNGTQVTGYSASWQIGNALASDFVIESNAVRTPFNRNLALHLHWNGVFSSDHFAEAKITQVGSVNQLIGVCVRASPGNAYAFIVDGTNFQIWKNVAYSFSALTSGLQAVTAGDTIRLEASSTTLTAKVNGATIATLTDASLSGGAPGIAGNSDTSGSVYTLLDDWVGDDLSAAALQFYQYDWPHQLHARR